MTSIYFNSGILNNVIKANMSKNEPYHLCKTFPILDNSNTLHVQRFISGLLIADKTSH